MALDSWAAVGAQPQAKGPRLPGASANGCRCWQMKGGRGSDKKGCASHPAPLAAHACLSVAGPAKAPCAVPPPPAACREREDAGVSAM